MIVEQEYGGLNERMYPSLLPQNVYTTTQGVVYRSGQACRINGKQLITKLPNAVLSIFPLPNSPFAILQTLTATYTIPISRLFIPPSEPLETQNGSLIETQDGNIIYTNP